jgi:hypothetical protein
MSSMPFTRRFQPENNEIWIVLDEIYAPSANPGNCHQYPRLKIPKKTWNFGALRREGNCRCADERGAFCSDRVASPAPTAGGIGGGGRRCPTVSISVTTSTMNVPQAKRRLPQNFFEDRDDVAQRQFAAICIEALIGGGRSGDIALEFTLDDGSMKDAIQARPGWRTQATLESGRPYRAPATKPSTITHHCRSQSTPSRQAAGQKCHAN